MTDLLEKCFWKVAIRIIENGYGKCVGDEPECAACNATNVVKWIERHIQLLER